MSTTQVKKIVKQYASVLHKNKFAFSKIYLFGSYAKDKAQKDSDIDVAIIANKTGSGKAYLNKKMKLWELTIDVDTRIEPILIEEKDLKNGSTIMGNEIKKYGIRVE